MSTTHDTVAERMKATQARLDESIRRINKAFASIDQSYRQLAVDCPRLIAETGRLGQTMDSLEVNLLRYDGELASVQTGVRELGDKSRRLEGIMDDFLTGRTPRRPARAAA